MSGEEEELPSAAEERAAPRAADRGESSAVPALSFLIDRSAAPRPHWICGDAAVEVERLEAESFDFLFTCPPYGNLEIYSDDPRDLSAAKSYAEFLGGFEAIIARACSRLRADRFAAIVVSDFRGDWTKDGCYAGFRSDAIHAFEKAGLRLYNEAVLVAPAASLPLRAARIFSGGRKLGRMHQDLLVFVKGDPGKAHAACGPVDLTALLEAEGGSGGEGEAEAGGSAEGA